MRQKKAILKTVACAVLVVAVIAGAGYTYQVHFNYNFATISDGKVYKSGAIPPHELPGYVKRYQLKTVVDLRGPDDQDEQKAVDREQEVLTKMGVKHVHLPTGQVPQQETVDKFLDLMSNEDIYPVLIHCHHGEGRAHLFSALYRIEFEGWDNEKARLATRWITQGSSFDTDRGKGRYLENYVPKHKRPVTAQ